MWSERRRGVTSVRVAERAPGGGWSEPEAIVDGVRWNVILADLAVNGGGDAAVLFSYLSRHRHVLHGAYRPGGGRFEAPQAGRPKRASCLVSTCSSAPGPAHP